MRVRVSPPRLGSRRCSVGTNRSRRLPPVRTPGPPPPARNGAARCPPGHQDRPARHQTSPRGRRTGPLGHDRPRIRPRVFGPVEQEPGLRATARQRARGEGAGPEPAAPALRPPAPEPAAPRRVRRPRAAAPPNSGLRATGSAWYSAWNSASGSAPSRDSAKSSATHSLPPKSRVTANLRSPMGSARHLATVRHLATGWPWAIRTAPRTGPGSGSGSDAGSRERRRGRRSGSRPRPRRRRAGPAGWRVVGSHGGAYQYLGLRASSWSGC